ncbi:MAG: hypothetical protein HUU30_12795 [Burkholderiaceae bacterium]|nr:hypothetical protein [Burkholderiaceae bacterium]
MSQGIVALNLCCIRRRQLPRLRRLRLDARLPLLRPLPPAPRIEFKTLGADGLHIDTQSLARALQAGFDQELPGADLPVLLEALASLAFGNIQASPGFLGGLRRLRPGGRSQRQHRQ